MIETESEYPVILDCISCNRNLYNNEKLRNMALCNICSKKVLTEHFSLKKFNNSGSLDLSFLNQEKSIRLTERINAYEKHFKSKKYINK